MELHKLTAKDIKGYDQPKLTETESDIRKELAKIRMDVLTAPNQHTGKVRGLRKSLARVLTVKGASHKDKLAVGAQAAKTPTAPAAAKAPKAASKAATASKAKTKTATK